MMRVYIPLDRPRLEGLARSGLVEPGRGYAVTPGFAEAYGSDDVEQLEYAALMAAADASAKPGGDTERIVVAADVAIVEPVGDEHPAAVDVIRAVPLADVASIHVGDAGDDLAWYATQELGVVLDDRPGTRE